MRNDFVCLNLKKKNKYGNNINNRKSKEIFERGNCERLSVILLRLAR